MARPNVWRYDPRFRTLTVQHAQGEYEVDLDDCDTAAEVLDWIVQVARKAWATDVILADLVRAFHDLLRPQATLCSMGVAKPPINVRAVLAGRDVRPVPETYAEFMGL
jgi:hypothetical protein